jgi:dihydropteroate synthase
VPAFETRLHGVINASPDSLNADSIATTPAAALARARALIADGCVGIDLGGQGSTDIATVVDPADEWARVADIVPALASLGVELSIDTWKPAVARLALEHGATILNAADGMQLDEMWSVAAELARAVVLPFLNGPDPRHLEHVRGDPVDVMVDWFEAQLAVATRYGVRERMILDPGTGFAPREWPWEERYVFQKHVYSNLDRLRVFGLPLYIALPWKDTPQHNELLDIVIGQRVEYGRTHYPAVVVAAARRLGFHS